MKKKAHLHLPKMKRGDMDCISLANFAHVKGEPTTYWGTVVMREVRFKVSQPGRERTLREGVKNVHAWVVGEVVETLGNQVIPNKRGVWREAYYNPRMTETFVDKQTGIRLDTAKAAYLVGPKVFYIPE